MRLALFAIDQISPAFTAGPSFADLMDMAETYSSFQRFERHDENNDDRPYNATTPPHNDIT